MFRLIVMQNQWLMMALLGGLALIGAVVLWYLDLWRQREPAGQGGALDQAPLRRWIRFMPWLLIWLYVVGGGLRAPHGRHRAKLVRGKATGNRYQVPDY
jgi:hypothetical protein